MLRFAGPGRLLGYAVMVKQEAGYFPDGGDWMYEMRMLDGSIMDDEESGMPMSGPIAMCAGCHAAASATDYLAATTLR